MSGGQQVPPDLRVTGATTRPNDPPNDDQGLVTRPIFNPAGPAAPVTIVAPLPLPVDIVALTAPNPLPVEIVAPDPLIVDLTSTDAFGRYRVSEPTTIFDSQQIVDSQPFFWDDAQTAGAGTTTTFNPNQASTTIAVANLTAGTRVRQTKRSIFYQPGKSQLLFLTFAMGAPAAGVTQIVGQFNAGNGIFFQAAGATLQFGIRSSTSGAPVDTVVAQAAWNLDRLDGAGGVTNPSGITLDVTRVQILVIDYQWLAAGRVRVGFDIGGVVIYAHEFLTANVLSLVYMSLADLPARYEIQNDGTGPARGLVHICVSANSEGGRQNGGLQYSVDRLQTGMQTLNNTNLYPVISMRLRAGFTYATVVPIVMTMLNTTNANFLWRLVLNPTVVGVGLVFATPFATSAIEADLTSVNTTTITPGTGTVIASGYGAANTSVDLELPDDVALGVTIAGVSDILVLAVSRITGTTETFFASLGYRELR